MVACISQIRTLFLRLFKTMGRMSVLEPSPKPAANDLFTIKDEGSLFPVTKGELFHSIFEILLFILKRSRPDITLTVASLCVRVSRSTYGDWEKQRRLLKYLYRTRDLVRVLNIGMKGYLALWTDVSFDENSHGDRTIYWRSNRRYGIIQTETGDEELDRGRARGSIGYHHMEHMDGEFSSGAQLSTIKLESNGRKSSSGRNKHINIKYFFNYRCDQEGKYLYQTLSH